MGVGSYLLPGVLTNFRESHPDADITLNVVQPQEALRQIATGESDFAVTSWNADEVRSDIRTSVLRDEPLVVVVRADMLPQEGTLTLEDALRLPLVGAPGLVAAQRSLESQLRGLSDFEPKYVIRLGHALSAKQAVVDHGWAAILPKYVVDADVASGTLAIVQVPGLDVQERLVLAWRPDKVFSKLHQRLMDTIRRALGDAAVGASNGGDR
jgi:DNA-binding transcriptional LysR family regulator